MIYKVPKHEWNQLLRVSAGLIIEIYLNPTQITNNN